MRYLLILLTLFTIGCSQKQVATHMGTGVGAVTGYANGNWGSITINRTYVNNTFRCRDYESVISIEHSWPMNGISRESEIGTACQLPDGRWKIIESTS